MAITKHKISNLNKCIIEAQQFILALHRQFWLGAVISSFSSQILIKMTHEEFKAKLEAIPNLELAEMAQKALSKLCSTGGQSFTMTVPPRLDDTDMVLSEVIKRFELLHLESVQNCL